ncbi:MAG: DNA-3-methyladenine glycosylase I [Haliea sp.]|nr:DNA-3-methyladenine glycosylase I [Haliea sp.]|tara:strand:- start:36504 stop:37091 length:588 start_codon:yes stop_codon:yes gene_type:complete
MSGGLMKQRCDWCAGDELYQRYHDREWGVPVHDDRQLFEFLLLEGAQAGLSWITILRKREGYRHAFHAFDPERVARMTDTELETLRENPDIIRNRRKIQAARQNARAFLEVQARHGSFADYLWDFVDGTPIQNHWKSLAEVPASTALSERLSRDLRRQGFSFVGPTIVYAHMQATGMVNDHLVQCFRHAECAQLA